MMIIITFDWGGKGAQFKSKIRGYTYCTHSTGKHSTVLHWILAFIFIYIYIFTFFLSRVYVYSITLGIQGFKKPKWCGGKVRWWYMGGAHCFPYDFPVQTSCTWAFDSLGNRKLEWKNKNQKKTFEIVTHSEVLTIPKPANEIVFFQIKKKKIRNQKQQFPFNPRVVFLHQKAFHMVLRSSTQSQHPLVSFIHLYILWAGLPHTNYSTLSL